MRGHITDPTAPDGLTLRELPEPDPGANEVVVEVTAYAVNRGEISLLADRSDGWTPGQDVAGTVLRAAPDGSGPAAGTRVVGMADHGGWSERAVVPTHRVAELPGGVSDAQAAALPVAGLTALRTLRTGGSLLGVRVLVTGASGGVGTFAVQLAVAAGARVTGLVSGERRVDLVRGLGAHDVVTALDEHTGPFEVIVDGVGGQVLVDAVHRLAPGGTLAAYGVAGGSDPAPLSFVDFATAPLARLVGFFVYETGQDSFGADLGTLAGLVADGRLDPQLGLVEDWTKTAAAVAALRAHRVTGKVVLTRGS